MSKILLISLVYNRKKLVGRALQSAINQTLPRDKWHHLVWDNASTDGANKVAETFCDKYPHMTFYQCDDNLGQQKAYNEILYKWIPKNMPKAEIITILDSDDELMPTALDEVDKIYSAHSEIGATYSGFSLVDKRGNYIVKDHGKAKMAPDQFTPEGQKQLRKMFVGANPCGHLRSYKVKALLDIGGFPTDRKYATDYCIFGAIMMKYPVIKIPKVLYKFYQHGDQVQGQDSPQQTADWKYYQKLFKKRFKAGGLM